MKIAHFLMQFLAFFLPLMSPYLGFIILRRETTIYEDADAMNNCRMAIWDNSEEGSQCRFQEKLNIVWCLTAIVIGISHASGFFFCVFTFKEHMENFTIKWLRVNLILILVFCVSCIIQYLCFRLCSACNCYHLVITYSNFNFELGDSFKLVRKAKGNYGCMTILTFLNCFKEIYLYPSK